MIPMKKKIFNFLLLSFVCFSGLVYANVGVEPPAPTSRPGGLGGDTGTVGAPAAALDMYVYILAIVAILMIVYFARKFKTQKL